MASHESSKAPLIYARIAGISYVLVIILGIVSAGIIDTTLIVSGDDAATATNLLQNESLFRMSTLASIILYASVLILSWSLYIVLKPVNKRLTLLAFAFRAAEGVLGAATAVLSLMILSVLGSGSQSIVALPAESLVGILLNTRTAALDIVLIFVGIGGSLFCFLLLSSRFIPRALAIWGIATYVSMVGLAVLSILWPDHPTSIETILYGSGTLFELAIGLWLSIKAIDIRKWEIYTSATP